MLKFLTFLILTIGIPSQVVLNAENSSFENRYKPGPKGPTGPTGPTGPAGKPGRNCECAYRCAFGELALQNAPQGQIIPSGLPGVTFTLFDSSGLSEKTTSNVSGGTILLQEPGTYMVTFHVSCVAQANHSLSFIAALDGVAQPNVVASLETLDKFVHTSLCGIIRAEKPNLTLSIIVRQFTGESLNLTCRTSNLSVVRIK